MKPSRFNRFSATSLAAIAMASSAHAADGTWTQLTSGGLWSNTANWSGGTIADGSGSTANFSTLNINPDNTVHLDSSRTLTNLVFGDTNSTHGWILGNNGVAGNILTLAGTTPTITVGALGAGKTATINAGIDGSGGLIKDGVGTLNLGTSSAGVLTSGGTANLTGGVTIKAGTLGLVGPIGSGAITLGDTTGGSTAAATLNVVGLGTNGNVPAYTNAIVLGATSGTLTINATTSGQLTLSGGVSGTNNLTIAENNANTGTMTFSTGSLNNTGTISNAGTGAAGTGVIISSVIGSNVTGLIQNGTTKLVLTNANTAFIGDTTLTSGNLNLRNTDSLQKSVLRMNGGSVTFGTSTTVAITSVALGGLSGSGNINLNNTLTAPTAVNLTIGNSNASYGGNTLNPTYSGVLSNTNGTASLTKTGSNTQTLTGANTYTGGTTISAGTLQLGSGSTTGKLSTTGAIVNNGNLTINRSNAVAQGTDFSAAAITGSGSFTQAGGGTTTLNATNTYTGATLITAGTLSLGHATDTLSSSSAVSVDGATAVLAIAGNSDTVGAVSLKNGGSITGSGGTLTGASYAVESGSVSAKLGGAGIALTKSTAGTVTLSGVNSYTGATLITGGTLALGASGTIDNTSEVSLGTVGTFDVSAKSGYAVGTLKGSGNVTGALTVSTTLAIGNSPGTINFSSNLTLDALSTYEYELIGGASPSLGSADLGDIAGNLNISAGSILDLVQLGAYTANNKFTLFAYDGTLTGTFDGLADGATFTDAGGIWTIDYNDTSAGANGGVSASNTYVTITAIPEPNAAALLGGLGVLALLRRRR
jgi:autotransporter-associated beta strand protein